MFAGKGGAYPSEAAAMCSLTLGLAPGPYPQTRVDKLALEKHSRL